jgi:hypothetical protein
MNAFLGLDPYLRPYLPGRHGPSPQIELLKIEAPPDSQAEDPFQLGKGGEQFAENKGRIDRTDACDHLKAGAAVEGDPGPLALLDVHMGWAEACP